MNLPLRVLLGYFLIVGVAAFFVLRVFVGEVRPGVRQTIEETMVDTANLLAVLATEDMKSGKIKTGMFARHLDEYRRRPVDANIWTFHKTTLDFQILITDARGIVVLDSEHEAEGLDYSKWNDVLRTLRGDYGARTTLANPDDESSTVFHVAAPILDNGRRIGVLTVAKRTAGIEPIIARSEQTIVRNGGLLLGFTLVIGAGVTFWLMGSIRRLRRYARAVAAGHRAEPPTTGGSELRELALAMAAMREKLEGRRYVEGYVQALTHELKSPLAALRGAGEILAESDLPEADRQRFAQHVLTQGARMQATIEHLLALSRLEARDSLAERRPVALRALLVEVSAQRRARAEAGRVALVVETPLEVTVSGDPAQLALALGNLIDNALDHAPANSQITITLARDGEQAALSVRDHGPGIPDYALPRVFERFYSLPRQDGAKGSGLGLAIVQEIAALHGGAVSLENAAPCGALACLRLPAE